MAANEIKKFASTATNILSQIEYEADAEKDSGNLPGTARSKLVNKAALQASIVAAALAQFIADNQGTDVTDALTPAALSAMFLAALQAAGISPDASTTVKGIAELATQTEVNTGTDALRIVSPATLAGRTANETRAGIAEIATQAEVDAGSDDARLVTPLKLAESPLSVKAWVSFDGSGAIGPSTINDSVGIASVTKTATGGYAFVLSDAMDNINYVVLGTTRQSGVTPMFVGQADAAKTTTTFSMVTFTGGAFADATEVYIAVLGKRT